MGGWVSDLSTLSWIASKANLLGEYSWVTLFGRTSCEASMETLFSHLIEVLTKAPEFEKSLINT